MSKKFFRRYSWFLVGYNVLVILWGAVVRSTGSGAGCGSNWPLCNGEIIPKAESVHTIIELIHRLTSTLDGFLVILLVLFAYRIHGKKSNIFRWAVAALVFIIIEGLLGRMLVVREWVADHVSVIRAVAVAIHLTNTYILLLTLTATAWLTGKQNELKSNKLRIVNYLLIPAIFLAILFSAMGAITALGDTLFPSESLITGFQKNFDPTSNFLIRLRVIHPILAILTSGYLLFVIRFIQSKQMGREVDKRGKWLQRVIFVQVFAGGITVLTLAPIFMQILHLLLADVFWISLVLYSLEVFTTSEQIDPLK